ncbi:MAG: hypothetical protein GX607_09235 [Myxococcales bacterium]|nr:hypothetical protein [Myxococcales bacterium]
MTTTSERTDTPDHAHVRGEIVHRPWRALASKPVVSVAVLLALGALAELAPGTGWARIFSTPTRLLADFDPPPDAQPRLEVGEAEITMDTRDVPGMAAPTLSGARPEPRPVDPAATLPAIEAEPPPVPLIDPSGRALDHFYAALARTQQREPGAITRVAHFGDSIVVSDFVSGTLRRKLQRTFGDAGHGYVLLANAWPAYFHNDVFRFATKGWKVSRIVGPLASDGFYGLGGVSFQAPAGVRARVGTAQEGEFGRRVSRFIVSYLEQPGGGRLQVNVDGEPHSVIDTNGPTKVGAHYEVKVPDGEHLLELVTQGPMTRAFGVVLERDEPGVVLDALGVQGARIRFLDKQDDEHWAAELQWRKPNLLVYQFGANESGDGYAYPMDEYLHTMKLVLEQGQRALPEASCLIIGAMDRARVENGAVTSMRIIQLIIQEQRRAAEQVGCAYFDTYESMGGWGSMPSWVRRGLGQADMTHPTGVGADRIATWIYGALMQGYDQYLARRAAGGAAGGKDAAIDTPTPGAAESEAAESEAAE